MQEDATVVHQTEAPGRADCPPGLQLGTPEIGVIVILTRWSSGDAYT